MEDEFEVSDIYTVSALNRHLPDFPDHLLWATFDPSGLDLKVWLSTYGQGRPSLEAACVAHWRSHEHGVRSDSIIAAYESDFGWRWWFLSDLGTALDPIDQPDLSFLPPLQVYRWKMKPK
jgi:hypothetical protein